MSRYELNEKVIWITGASSGIGKSLALALAENNIVVASSRNEKRLEALAKTNPNIQALPADVTNPENLANVARDIQRGFGRLDLLIANAGDCIYLDVNAFDSFAAKSMIDTNYLGFVYTLEAALPLLRQSKAPYICAISSSSIYAGLPRAAAYSASKAAISQFMECLAADLRHEGFHLSVVHPGFVDTPLTQANDFPMPFMVSPQQSVKHILKGLERTQFNIEFPKRLTLLLKSLKLAPPFIRHRITSKLSRNASHGY